MDFGIAIHDEITHETLACGTRMYSSPEQTRKNCKIDGRSGHTQRHSGGTSRMQLAGPLSRFSVIVFFLVSLCSDIWSVGVILYQMLSLLVDVPFDPVEIVVNHTSVPPLSLYTQTPLSPQFHSTIMRALEVDPANRWQTAEEFGDALHAEEMRIRDGSRSSHTTHDDTHTQAPAPADSRGAPAAAVPSLSSTTAASSSSSGAAAAPVRASAAAAASSALPSDADLPPRLQRARRGMAFSSGADTDTRSKL